MKKKDYDEYCEWLFKILFELEKRVDISKYDKYQGRLCAFMSERLFNVWIIYKKYNVKNANIIMLENRTIFQPKKYN